MSELLLCVKIEYRKKFELLNNTFCMKDSLMCISQIHNLQILAHERSLEKVILFYLYFRYYDGYR